MGLQQTKSHIGLLSTPTSRGCVQEYAHEHAAVRKRLVANQRVTVHEEERKPGVAGSIKQHPARKLACFIQGTGACLTELAAHAIVEAAEQVWLMPLLLSGVQSSLERDCQTHHVHTLFFPGCLLVYQASDAMGENARLVWSKARRWCVHMQPSRNSAGFLNKNRVAKNHPDLLQ
jgi:hypothetical protein